MRKYIWLMFFYLVYPEIGNTAPLIVQVATNAPDLHTVQQTLIRYHDKGEYIHEIQQVSIEAKKQLARILLEKNQRPLAIVFDIDETTLSSWPLIKENQFHYDPLSWNEWESSKKAQAILPILSLYQMAIKNHVAVFFITRRLESARKVTEENLKKAGYHQYNAIYLQPNNLHENSTTYKTSIRKKIIVMSVSDQYSDLCGGYAKILVKLPNPFYYIPGCSPSELKSLQDA